MDLTSPVPLEPISARYTCDGANVSLPFSWSGVPARTAEIDLFVFEVKGTRPAWAVAGLRPGVHRLAAGTLPAGAVVGRNALGQNRYSVCPPKGLKATYVVRVFPLPRRLAASPGFNVDALFNRILHIATSSGLLAFSYQRR